MSKSIKKPTAANPTLKRIKSPRFSLVESKARYGACYGFCHFDSTPVMISADKNEALDYIFKLLRNEVKEHEAIDTSVQTEVDPDETEAPAPEVAEEVEE